MPDTGAPANIVYPDDTYPIAPLENLFLAQATSINLAFSALYANGWARGNATQYVVSNLAALDAVSTGIIGDTAFMTTPGTGINALSWEAYAGSGAGLDWRPAETIYASSKTNMDSFISAVAAIADTRFEVGGEWIDTTTGWRYRFTSTAGAYVLNMQGIVPIVPTTLLGSGGTRTLNADGSISFSGAVASVGATLGSNAEVAAFRRITQEFECDGSTAGSFTSQNTASGTPNATGSSYRTTVDGSTPAAATSFGMGYVGARRLFRRTRTIHHLGDARATTFFEDVLDTDPSGSPGALVGPMVANGEHNQATAYNGQLVTLSGLGTISNGTMRWWGWL